jgi:potassium efflux system protein
VEQEAIAAALQAVRSGDVDMSLIQAQRWGMETGYVALSAEIRALDQELLSLPVRLALLAAKRDEAAASAERIGKEVGALRVRVNAQRAIEGDRVPAVTRRAALASDCVNCLR